MHEEGKGRCVLPEMKELGCHSRNPGDVHGMFLKLMLEKKAEGFDRLES